MYKGENEVMICKNCQTEVDGKATFCPNCGQSLTTPCPRCHAPVTETARFCHRCGMPLDGSAICGVCGSVVPSGAEFCPTCGSAKDGRRKCTGCGNIVEADCKFCPDCGNPLSTTTPRHYATRAAKPRESGNLKAFVYGLVRRWTIVAVLVTVFILSFFGMVKVPFGQFSSVIPEMQQLGIDDLNATGTDIVAAMFRMTNAPTQEKLEKDFEAFCTKRATKNWTPQKFIEKFGVLRLATFKETVKMPSFVMRVVSWGVLQLGIWCVLLAFLIYETMLAIRFTLHREGSGGKVFSLALTFGLVLGFVPLSCFHLADCATAILIILACTFIGLKICRHVVEGHPFVAYDFLRPIIGTVFTIILATLFLASAYIVEYAGTDYVVKASGGIENIIGQLNPVETVTTKPSAFFDNLKSLMTSLSAANRVLYLSALPPQALTALEACSEFIPGFIAMGYLTYFSGLAFTGIIAWVLIANLTALVDGKKTTHLAWDAVAAGLAIALMVFVIVSVSLGNSMVAGLEQQDVLLYKLAGMPIVAVVFACLNLVKSIVFAVLDKRKTAREIPAY